MRRISIIITLIILTIIPFSYAVNDFSYNRLYQGTQPIDGFNYSINVNSSNNWVTNIGTLSGVNVTQLSNIAGLLNIDTSWLAGFIEIVGDELYCKLTGCTMQGDLDMDANDILDVGNLEVNNNLTVGGFVNITNMTFIGDRLFVGLDPGPAQGIINPGDVGIGGNLIIAQGGIGVYPDKYTLSAAFFNNGADDPGETIFYTNFSGELNTSEQLFCDYLNNPFNDSNKRDAIFVVFSAEFGTDNIYLPINSIVNSSCVTVATQIFGNDDVPELTTISYLISPQPVFGVTDNDLVLNGIRMFYETNESLDTFGSYTRQNTLQDKPGGNLFADAFTNTAGELEYVFGTQTGLNTSGNFFRNSLGIWSTRNYNITQKQDLEFLHNMEQRWLFINVSHLLDYFSSQNGADLAVEHGIETQKLILHDDLGNGELLGEGLFQWILRDGEHFNIREGGIHISDESIKEFGFPLGANITIFMEDFETATLDRFTLITSGKGLDEWAVDADVSGDCPTVSESFICIHAGPTGGSGDTIIQTNFTTIDLELNDVAFYINTEDMASGGDFEITMNNNVGSGDVSIYSTAIDVLDQQIVTSIPASMDDQTKVTMEFVFSSSHPIRGDTWIDMITINATTTDSSLQNVSVQEGIIKFGDESCFISQEVINENLHQEMNISCDFINIIGNTTFVNVEEQNLNVTENLVIGGNLTISSLTEGSVLFAGADGLVSEDNSGLFWDEVNKRLGIGTNSPDGKLNIQSESGARISFDEVDFSPFKMIEMSMTLGIMGTPLSSGFGSIKDILYIRGATQNPSLVFSNDLSGTVKTGTIRYSIPNNQFMFEDVDSTKMVSDVWITGDTGLGIAEPQEKLDINGSIMASGSLALGSNTMDGLSAGDINASTIYYDVLTAKSPIFQCSDDWCSVTFPKYQKTIWLQRNESTWKILGMMYDENSYTPQEFNSQICTINQVTQNICDRLIEKINKLQEKAIADNLLRQKIESCDYSFDGECFEIVKNIVNYNLAVITVQENITEQEEYSCTQLNEMFIPAIATCSRDIVVGTRNVLQFGDGCGWDVDDGYWCEERVLR